MFVCLLLFKNRSAYFGKRSVKTVIIRETIVFFFLVGFTLVFDFANINSGAIVIQELFLFTQRIYGVTRFAESYEFKYKRQLIQLQTINEQQAASGARMT